MRCAIVRVWASLATALLTGAAADAGTEFAENLGWLGGSLRDAQHQSVEPAFLLGLIVAGALAVFVAFARVAPHDPLLRCTGRLRALTADLALALAGSALVTIAMEGYETRFGGVSPFDPRSVVLAHAVPLLVAFVVVAAIVHCGLRTALRIAKQAGELAAGVFGELFCKVALSTAPSKAIAAMRFARLVRRLPPAIADNARGMRAPPRSILQICFTA